MNRAGEGGDDHATFGFSNAAIQAGEHRALGRAEARHFRVGGITEQAKHTLITVVGQASHIKVLTIDRGVVELEVTGEDHRAHRSGHRQRIAVGHRVGVANELDLEVLAELDHFARGHRLQHRAVSDAGFRHLSLEQGQGQTRAVNDRNVEVLEVVGDATDVVFMTVGDDHAANALLVLAQEAGVWHHHVHPVHAVAGERQTGINQNQVVAEFKNTGVLSDLVQAAQGDHPQGGLLGLGTVGAHIKKREIDANTNGARARPSPGVKWDAGRPSGWRGCHGRSYRLASRADGEHRQAIPEVPTPL